MTFYWKYLGLGFESRHLHQLFIFSSVVAIPPLLLPFAIGGIEPYAPFFMAAIAYVPCAALRVVSIELFAVLWACPIGYMATIPKGLLRALA